MDPLISRVRRPDKTKMNNYGNPIRKCKIEKYTTKNSDKEMKRDRDVRKWAGRRKREGKRYNIWYSVIYPIIRK